MTDQINKELRKLDSKRQKMYLNLIEQIMIGDIQNLDVAKLKGSDQVFRVRKGVYRIIFRKYPNGDIKILAFEHRSETTYRLY